MNNVVTYKTIPCQFQKKHRRSRSAVVATTTVLTDGAETNVKSEVSFDGKTKTIEMGSGRKRGMKKYHSDSMAKENGINLIDILYLTFHCVVIMDNFWRNPSVRLIHAITAV